MWARLVRWLAREHLEYLEYENKELRYEGERWRHRYEGAMDALRVFERRYYWMEKTMTDAAALTPMQPTIIQREQNR